MNGPSLTLAQRFKLSRFIHGEAPVKGPLTLNQRRIFILPSRYGLLFAGLIVLLLLIAFVYNNNLVYMLGFLLASVFFVTILHSFKNLQGLVVRAGHHEAVFAGTPAVFSFHIQNPAPQSRLAIDVTLEQVVTVDLVPNQIQTLHFETLCNRRGWRLCGTLTVCSHYPLGLFRAWSPLRFDSKVLVYPLPKLNGLPLPLNDSGHGEYSLSSTQGDEFYGLKTYQNGDSMRQIHWKTLAKGRGLHSKKYSDTSNHELWLDYASAPGNGLEERLSQLCRWVLDAECGGLKYGLLLPGVKIAPANGKAHQCQCLEALALF